ncbi:MAG TPA: sulfotransferase, partial [Syntrophales bacterium]|nr:sulfotransferase [Syntrophales bacterium]
MENTQRSYCFVFICQQGDLEIKSMLLAASLKQYLNCSSDLVAAVPQPEEKWGSPAPSTIKQLEELGARIVNITNDIHPDYPIGNKVSCLRIPTKADKVIFMDSDMLCLRPFKDEDRFAIPFNAKPADLSTYAVDEALWRKIYHCAGAEMPSLKLPTTVSGDYMPPYFNAGFIAIDAGTPLGDVWLDCCRKIDADSGIPNKRPWLDQIALPVALQKLKLAFDSLDEGYNYPAHLKTINPRQIPFFCHYHHPEVIRREPLMNRLVCDLADRFPVMRNAMMQRPEWKTLLSQHTGVSVLPWWRNFVRKGKTQDISLPELIITGIPRSGTSYLSSLLHQVDNCVVINEPTEIFDPLIQQRIPWGVATYYRNVRKDILDGHPVKNKISGNRVIEDTAVEDKRSDYCPNVSTPDFILGTKNTLAYLTRLEVLTRSMPQAHIVACVRNPFDTIASWKSTFAHLREADVSSFPVGHPNDPFLSARQKEAT